MLYHPLITKLLWLSNLTIASNAFSTPHNRRCTRSLLRNPLFQQSSEQQEAISTSSSTADNTDDDVTATDTTTITRQKPLWMKCINAVVPAKVTALNEAVAMVANVSR